MGGRRKAYHAGSWYSDEAEVLQQQLTRYLHEARPGTLAKVAPDSKVRRDSKQESHLNISSSSVSIIIIIIIIVTGMCPVSDSIIFVSIAEGDHWASCGLLVQRQDGGVRLRRHRPK